MNEVQVMRAEAEDFEEIYGFINVLENRTFDRVQQRLIFLDNIASPNNLYLIAKLEGKTVGFLSCHVQNLLHHSGPVAENQEIFVEPDRRNLGIGAKLVDVLKSIARSRDIIQLEVTSNQQREFAHHFYLNQNFVNTHKKFVLKL
jgi:(aminoalkyl)phosphonate N-acetyltransferase